jgi:nitrogen regulatory protein PII
MNFAEIHSDYSLVTAILPKQSVGDVVTEVLKMGAPQVMSNGARGTLLQERWWQRMLPAISPEQEMLYFLAPNSEADTLMEQIVMVGKLRLFGAGAIFAVPCRELSCSADFPLWKPGQYRFESVDFDIKFKTGLVALFHVHDRAAATPISRAAIKAGAQGATITFVRGFGLRDRLGLLRVTKSHDKEMITVVVDEYDRDAVFEAMATAGRVGQPGRGLVFELPVSKGLTNLASVFQPSKHSASIQQMVRAIDDLQGGTEWRASSLLTHNAAGAAAFATRGKPANKDLRMLNVICQRKDSGALTSFLLDTGVSGASVSHWRYTDDSCGQTLGGLRINREVACISLILPAAAVPVCRENLQQFASEHEMRELCFFTHTIPAARTFGDLTALPAGVGAE